MRAVVFLLVLISLSGCDFLNRFEDKTQVILEIDSRWAGQARLDYLQDEIRNFMRSKNQRYDSLQRQNDTLRLKYKPNSQFELMASLRKEFPELIINDDLTQTETPYRYLVLRMPDKIRDEIIGMARDYNMDVIARLLNDRGIDTKFKSIGMDRIELELAENNVDQGLLNLITRYQHLALYLVSKDDASYGFTVTMADQTPLHLEHESVITGDSIIKAFAEEDRMSQQPAIAVELDDTSAEHMRTVTRANLGKKMAVLLVEYKYGEDKVQGYQDAKVLSVATIQGVFGKRFIITGLDDMQEARALADHMRAGELATPLRVVRVDGKTIPLENKVRESAKPEARTRQAQ